MKIEPLRRLRYDGDAEQAQLSMDGLCRVSVYSTTVTVRFSAMFRNAERLCHWFSLSLLLSVLACQPRPWEGSLESREALGRAVIGAWNAGDADALHRLRVTESEYVGWLYPAFPSSEPPYNFPPDFAWQNLNKKCLVGVRRQLAEYGKRGLTFVNIRFEKPVETYGDFRLRRGTVLVARDGSGKVLELRVLGSLVERHGRFKLLSYQD